MNARLLGALAAALLATGSAPAAACSRPQAHPLAEPVTLPIELASNLIFLRASVKDAPLAFVLDTGDRYALIELARAQALGLELGGTIDVGGTGSGALPGRFVQGASFGLAGLEGFEQPLFLALPLDSLAPAVGHEFSGILGADFLAAFVVEVDYARKVVVLHDRESFRAPEGLASLPFTLDSQSHPVVRARVRVAEREPLEGDFVLDTGANDVLTLHAPFVAREHLLDAAGAAAPRAGSRGAGGTSEGVLARLEALELGPFRVADPVVVLSTASGGAHASAEASGSIGGACLRRFRVFLDYGRKCVLLEPNEGFAEPFEHDMSGLRVLAEGADFRTFRVSEVVAAWPAAEAGVRAEDVLREIDGRTAMELTLSEVRERLRREGPCRLTVERAGERLELELELRRRV